MSYNLFMGFRVPNILPFTLTVQSGTDTYAVRLNSRQTAIRSMAVYPDVHANFQANLRNRPGSRIPTAPLPHKVLNALPSDIHSQLVSSYAEGGTVDTAVLALLQSIPTSQPVQVPQIAPPAIAV